MGDEAAPSAPSRSPERGARGPSPVRRTIATACLGTLLVMVCYPMPMLNLPSLATGLGAGPGASTWLISGISMGLGAALLPAGTLADNCGRKAVFTGGMALLTAGTLACGLAPTAGVFIAGRTVQGIGGAAVLATGLALIDAASATRRQRIRGTGLWGAALGAGLALGPVVVGAGAETAPWRAAYLVVAVALAAVTVVGAVRLTESRAADPQPLDVPGALLAVLAVGSLMALLSLRGPAWQGALPWVLAGAAAVAAALFVAVERRTAHPLLPPALFRQAPFLGSIAAAAVTGIAVVGLLSYVPAVMQAALGTGTLATALYFLVWSGSSAVVAVVAPRLLSGVPARYQVAAGLAGCALGQALLVLMSDGRPAAFALPGLAVCGVALGLVNANLGRLAVETAPAGRGALGSGVSNTARYLGSTAGLPVVILVVGLGGADPEGMLAGLHHAAFAAAAVALAGAALVALLADRRAPRT
ncbi:MFS transporter [Streptomonospora wellingtoniae]|uniref:MFS transporter n=1 Tax=Streptomonospora wellingtoniae TaxID=3075544 RepID=A0ABU2KSA2_9ACTN|nr:MFS transporter [Streptomonospora sp. DSM 45055]MDT0302130.1 MFS transporter [Streptomonospora sp. DSM 45055]